MTANFPAWLLVGLCAGWMLWPQPARQPGGFIYPKERRPPADLTDACNQRIGVAPLMVLARLEGQPGLEILWDKRTLYVKVDRPAWVALGRKRASPVAAAGGWWWVEGGWTLMVQDELDVPLGLLKPDTEYCIQAALPGQPSVAWHVRTRAIQAEPAPYLPEDK